MTDELANWILSELEEARYEEFTTLFNTMFQAAGSEHEMRRFQLATRTLVVDGLVTIVPEHARSSRVSDLTQTEALSYVDTLATVIRFEPSEKYWYYAPNFEKPFERRAPGLFLTEAGLARARALLTQRGYRWWQD